MIGSSAIDYTILARDRCQVQIEVGASGSRLADRDRPRVDGDFSGRFAIARVMIAAHASGMRQPVCDRMLRSAVVIDSP